MPLVWHALHHLPVQEWGWSCQPSKSLIFYNTPPKLWRESEPLNVNLADRESLSHTLHTDELAVCWHAAECCEFVCMREEEREKERERESTSLRTATQGCCCRRANQKLPSRRYNVRMLKCEQCFYISASTVVHNFPPAPQSISHKNWIRQWKKNRTFSVWWYRLIWFYRVCPRHSNCRTCSLLCMNY